MANKINFCGNCGAQIPAGSKFCPKCGAKVPDYLQDMAGAEDTDTLPDQMDLSDIPDLQEVQEDVDSINSDQADAPDWEEEEPEERESSTNFSSLLKSFPKSLIKWIIIAAAVVVAVIILIVVLVSPGSIKLDNYILMESSGVDGYGTVRCNFDEEAFYKDYYGKVELTKKSPSYGFLTDESSAVYMLEDYISWNLEFPDAENGYLSNGDRAVLTWNCDDSTVKKYFTKKLKHPDITYDVSGLSPVDTVNVFDYVNVILSGAEPAGVASIELSGGEDLGIGTQDFSISPSEGLCNGDIVTVSFNQDVAADLSVYKAVSPTSLTKDYEVSGLPDFIIQIDEIPEDTLSEMCGIAEEAIQSDGSSHFVDGVTITGLTYEGCYLVYSDPNEADSYFSTELYLVYKVDVKEDIAELNVDDSFSYYTYVKFYDLVLMQDGTCVFDSDNYNICHNSFSLQYGDSADQKGTFYGFPSTQDLMDSIIDDSYMLYDTDIEATDESSVPVDSIVSSDSASAAGVSGDTVQIVASDGTSSGDYLCSYSSDRLITDNDLSALRQSDYGTLPGGRSIEQMVVNELYAKHGYQFTDSEVQQYFDQKAWYKAIGSYSSDMDAVKGQMNSIEKRNVDYLGSFL